MPPLVRKPIGGRQFSFSPEPPEPEPKRQDDVLGRVGNLDDPPMHFRPIVPASAGATDKNPMGSGHYDTPSIASRPLNRNGFHRGKCQESRGRRPKFAFRGNSRSAAVARNCPNVALCHVHIDPPAASRRCDRWRPKLRIQAGTGCGAFPAPSWRCPCSRCSRSSATVSSPGPPSVGRSKARSKPDHLKPDPMHAKTWRCRQHAAPASPSWPGRTEP
jgi:hypothetical protein